MDLAVAANGDLLTKAYIDDGTGFAGSAFESPTSVRSAPSPQDLHLLLSPNVKVNNIHIRMTPMEPVVIKIDGFILERISDLFHIVIPEVRTNVRDLSMLVGGAGTVSFTVELVMSQEFFFTHLSDLILAQATEKHLLR